MRIKIIIILISLITGMFSYQSYQITDGGCPDDIGIKNIHLSPFLQYQIPIFFVGNLNGSSNPEIYCKRQSGGTFHNIGSMIVAGNIAIKADVSAGQILVICDDGSGGEIVWKVVATDKNGQKCDQGYTSSFSIRL